MIRTAASLLGLTAAFGLVLYLTLGDGDSSSSPTATPSPFVQNSTPTQTPTVTSPPTPTPAPLPAVLQDSGVTSLEVRNLVSFPANMSLIFETGCWQCGEPPTGLRRMYRDPDRELRIEQLLSIEDLGLPPRIVLTSDGPEELPPFITGLAVAPGVSKMLVSVCVNGPCDALPHAGPVEGRVAMFESTDGGVTWRQLGDDYDATFRVDGYIAPGVALVSRIDHDTLQGQSFRFPSLEPLQNPRGYSPVLSFGGDVIWGSKGGAFLDESGELFLDLGPSTFAGASTVTYSGHGGVQLLAWLWEVLPNRPADGTS